MRRKQSIITLGLLAVLACWVAGGVAGAQEYTVGAEPSELALKLSHGEAAGDIVCCAPTKDDYPEPPPYDFTQGMRGDPYGVLVTSTPTGADIYVDGATTALTTPEVLTLSDEPHIIRVAIPGYRGQQEEVTELIALHFDLDEIPDIWDRSPTPAVTTLAAPYGATVVALYDLTALGGGTYSQWSGAVNCLDMLGIPYRIITDTADLSDYSFCVMTGTMDSISMSAGQVADLLDWINQGNVLVSAGIGDARFLGPLGLTASGQLESRSMIYFESVASPLLTYVDHPLELEILVPLVVNPSEYTKTRHYDGADTVLAKYDDGENAFVATSYGSGRVIMFGVRFNDFLTRFETHSFVGGTRGYTNLFEPSADVMRLMVRAAYEYYAANPYVRPFAPASKSAAVILTHDVDAPDAYVNMQAFMDLAELYGGKSTIFVTTNTEWNGWISDVYVESRKTFLQLALDRGFDIQDHTVGHFPDFDDFEPGPYESDPDQYNPFYNSGTESTEGGFVLPELLVSARQLEQDFLISIRGFRPGHLVYPRELGQCLQDTGYYYSSHYPIGYTATNFPYRLRHERRMSGVFTNVLALPFTISDRNFRERDEVDPVEEANNWLDVTLANAANNAVTVLLIHPTNPEDKLIAFELYLQGLQSQDVWIGDMQSFYEFWRSTGITSDQDHVSPPMPFDGDGDDDVDLADFLIFQTCYTGPGGGPVGPECEVMDDNGDGDVDLSDFLAFQTAFTGPL